MQRMKYSMKQIVHCNETMQQTDKHIFKELINYAIVCSLFNTYCIL